MTNARFGRWNLFRLLQCRTHSIWYTVYTAHVYLHTTGFRELFTHQHGISTALSPFFHLCAHGAGRVLQPPRHARGAAGGRVRGGSRKIRNSNEIRHRTNTPSRVGARPARCVECVRSSVVTSIGVAACEPAVSSVAGARRRCTRLAGAPDLWLTLSLRL